MLLLTFLPLLSPLLKNSPLKFEINREFGTKSNSNGNGGPGLNNARPGVSQGSNAGNGNPLHGLIDQSLRSALNILISNMPQQDNGETKDRGDEKDKGGAKDNGGAKNKGGAKDKGSAQNKNEDSKDKEQNSLIPSNKPGSTIAPNANGNNAGSVISVSKSESSSDIAKTTAKPKVGKKRRNSDQN